MSIRVATPPDEVKQPRVDFNKSQFETLIWNKGYKVIKYDAVQCPCQNTQSTNLSGCENCLGLGWVYINPLETLGIITAINLNTKYKYWSPEFKGTVALTLRDIERVSFMDKIILKDKTSILSEIKEVRDNAGQKFIFTSYPVNSINSIFLFDGVTNPLKRLTSLEYSISADNPYVVKLAAGITYPDDFNDVVSIDYNHNIQYNVVDIPHDVRSSLKINSNGKNESQELPIQAICQKSHYITGDSPKYDGAGIQDNSYL